MATLPIKLWPGMKIGQLCFFRLQLALGEPLRLGEVRLPLPGSARSDAVALAPELPPHRHLSPLSRPGGQRFSRPPACGGAGTKGRVDPTSPPCARVRRCARRGRSRQRAPAAADGEHGVRAAHHRALRISPSPVGIATVWPAEAAARPPRGAARPRPPADAAPAAAASITPPRPPVSSTQPRSAISRRPAGHRPAGPGPPARGHHGDLRRVPGHRVAAPSVTNGGPSRTIVPAGRVEGCPASAAAGPEGRRSWRRASGAHPRAEVAARPGEVGVTALPPVHLGQRGQRRGRGRARCPGCPGRRAAMWWWPAADMCIRSMSQSRQSRTRATASSPPAGRRGGRRSRAPARCRSQPVRAGAGTPEPSRGRSR